MLSRIARSAWNRAYGLALLTRGLRFRFLALFGALKLGRRLKLGQGVDLRLYGRLEIGSDVYLDAHCSLQVSPGARLVIGDGVFVGLGSIVCAASDIVIGDHVLIAEHCSVRDSDHQLDPIARRRETSAQCSPVSLGPDVWLGAGVRVLRGASVGTGTIVAANSVVKGELPPRSIAAGAPARVIRSIDEHMSSASGCRGPRKETDTS